MNKAAIDPLTTLRFFAALSIFLHHLRAFGIDLSSKLWGLNLGWTVSFFYVLSGFVLSYSYHNRINTIGDTGRFIMIRFFRLWPLHLACGALALVLVGVPRDTDYEKVYLFLTLQHSWIPSYETAFFLNAVSWSISVELFFYISFGLIVLLNGRTRMALMAAWALAVIGLMLFVSWNPGAIPFSTTRAANGLPGGISQSSFFHMFPPIRIIEFFAGMLTFSLFRRARLPAPMVVPAQAATLLLVIYYITVHSTIVGWISANVPMIFARNYVHYGMFPLFALVVYVFAHEEGIISRLMSAGPLVFLGNISFAFYMVHQLVMTVMNVNQVTAGLGAVTAAVIAFIVATLLSWALYSFIEMPSLRWAKRTFSSPRRPTHQEEGQSDLSRQIPQLPPAVGG